MFQHLEIADHPLEVKNIIPTDDKSFYKMLIEESRIGLKYIRRENKLIIICFLYNQFLEL